MHAYVQSHTHGCHLHAEIIFAALLDRKLERSLPLGQLPPIRSCESLQLVQIRNNSSVGELDVVVATQAASQYSLVYQRKACTI